MLVIDSYSAVSEMHVDSNMRLDFDCRWATLESDLWHIHLDMESVTSIQFVEAADQFHEGIPKLYYVRLSDIDEHTLIRFYFPNPWLDDNEQPTCFQPHKLESFEIFRDQCVGRKGIIFSKIQ